jgi:penicillin-binding protein 1A
VVEIRRCAKIDASRAPRRVRPAKAMTVRERQRLRRRRRNDPARLVMIAFGVVFGALLIAGGGFAMYVISVWNQTPSLTSLHAVNVGDSSIVYAADGQRLGFIQGDNLRTPVPSTQIPSVVKEATVAIEDQRFYHHNGVDFQGVLRAAVKNLTSGGAVQGGSTITEQLVRNLYLGRERTLTRKLKEAKLAIDYEKQHSKDYILSDYLNTIPYGTVGGLSAIGIQAAARVFFDKPAGQLTLPQAALLAGLPQAPSDYNPFLDPQKALARRNEVLAKMLQLHYISPGEAATAQAAPLGVRHSNYYTAHRESFFFDYVKQQLIDRYGVNTVLKGGLRIYTTIEPRLQNVARQSILKDLGTRGDPASAIVSIDPRNGHILAMAQSPLYSDQQFNLAAQGHRQAGSTFKTFVLLAALLQGVDPSSVSYTARSLNFTDPVWGPINIRSNGGGSTENVVSAFMQSNDPIFQLFDLDVGPRNVKRAAGDAGVTSPLDGLPAEGLGGLRVGVSPLEMANAYATIEDGGWRNTPEAITRVVFTDGHVDATGAPRRVKVFSDGVTAELTKLLQMYITNGLGTGANYGCANSGGKTGTTDNYTDAWFVGFTAHMSTAVWLGYPKSKIPMYNVEGVGQVSGPTIPATLWHDYMQNATQGDCAPFPQPTQPIQYLPFSGKYEAGGSGSALTGSGSGYGNGYGNGFGNGGGAPRHRGGVGGGNGTAGNGGNAVGPQGYQQNPGAYAGPPQGPPTGANSPPAGNGNVTGGAGGPAGH